MTVTNGFALAGAGFVKSCVFPTGMECSDSAKAADDPLPRGSMAFGSIKSVLRSGQYLVDVSAHNVAISQHDLIGDRTCDFGYDLGGNFL